MFRVYTVVVMSCVLLLSACSQTPPVKPVSIGSEVDFSLLEDQFGHKFTYQDVMNTVLYVNNMKAKNLVRDALAELDQSCLRDGKVVYLADISGMPALISKLIAVPRLRDYGYPVWLDYNGLATAALPVKDDEVTVLQLDKGAITAVEYDTDAKMLVQRLAPQCGTAKQRVVDNTSPH